MRGFNINLSELGKLKPPMDAFGNQLSFFNLTSRTTIGQQRMHLKHKVLLLDRSAQLTTAAVGSTRTDARSRNLA